MKTFEIEVPTGGFDIEQSEYVSVLEAGALEFYNENPLKTVAIYAPNTWRKVRELTGAELEQTMTYLK